MSTQTTFIDRNDTTLSRYLKDIRKCKSIASDEELSLILRAQNGDMKAREQLIKAHLTYVVHVANEYAQPTINVKDLIQAGNCGLIEAVHSFDASLGYRFLTFADDIIRKHIIEELADNYTIHIPDNEYRANKARKAQDITEDLFYERNLDTYDPYSVIAIDSLDAPMSEYSNQTISDMLYINDSERPDILCEQHSDIDYLLATVGSLPAKQGRAVMLIAGLEDGFEHSLETVADELSISRERARQLNEKGLSTLIGALTQCGYMPAA